MIHTKTAPPLQDIQDDHFSLYQSVSGGSFVSLINRPNLSAPDNECIPIGALTNGLHNIEDYPSADHVVIFNWSPICNTNNATITYSLDGVQLYSGIFYNYISHFGGHEVYWGFTAATWMSANKQTVSSSIDIQPVNICISDCSNHQINLENELKGSYPQYFSPNDSVYISVNNSNNYQHIYYFTTPNQTTNYTIVDVDKNTRYNLTINIVEQCAENVYNDYRIIGSNEPMVFKDLMKIDCEKHLLATDWVSQNNTDTVAVVFNVDCHGDPSDIQNKYYFSSSDPNYRLVTNVKAIAPNPSNLGGFTILGEVTFYNSTSTDNLDPIKSYIYVAKTDPNGNVTKTYNICQTSGGDHFFYKAVDLKVNPEYTVAVGYRSTPINQHNFDLVVCRINNVTLTKNIYLYNFPNLVDYLPAKFVIKEDTIAVIGNYLEQIYAQLLTNTGQYVNDVSGLYQIGCLSLISLTDPQRVFGAWTYEQNLVQDFTHDYIFQDIISATGSSDNGYYIGCEMKNWYGLAHWMSNTPNFTGVTPLHEDWNNNGLTISGGFNPSRISTGNFLSSVNTEPPSNHQFADVQINGMSLAYSTTSTKLWMNFISTSSINGNKENRIVERDPNALISSVPLAIFSIIGDPLKYKSGFINNLVGISSNNLTCAFSSAYTDIDGNVCFVNKIDDIALSPSCFENEAPFCQEYHRYRVPTTLIFEMDGNCSDLPLSSELVSIQANVKCQ